MARNIINLKSPNGTTISVSKDMEEYYLKMGYTKTSKVDTPKVIKLTPKKDKE